VDDIAPTVGTNLRHLRVKRGLSMERLAQASGVSRGMLGQIELGKSAPTINVLWKIARALNVTFSALIQSPVAGGTSVLRNTDARLLSSKDGRFTSRALFPFNQPRHLEFYLLGFAPGTVENAPPHPPGTVENLVVHEGALEIEIGGQVHRLRAGDAIQFVADMEHVYRNREAATATAYLVMTYAREVG
jgi:transcriptional regulator with XRE-family HTH domain